MINNSPLQYRIFKNIYRNAAKGMCLECKDYINPNSKILDLGCGSGIVGKVFSEEFDSDIVGIDIIDNRVEEIPFKMFDGEDLSSVSDNSFDVVLINYVLHHSQKPVELLREAKRISRGKIIIYENIPEGVLSKIFCKIHGISFAYLFQKNSVTGSFFTKKEWQDIFDKLELCVVHSQRIPSWHPMKQELFVLER